MFNWNVQERYDSKYLTWLCHLDIYHLGSIRQQQQSISNKKHPLAQLYVKTHQSASKNKLLAIKEIDKTPLKIALP
jgi:hypothetical protein